MSAQKFIPPGIYQREYPVDYKPSPIPVGHPTIQDTLKSGARFIIGSEFWYVMEYSIEYGGHFDDQRYRVTLQAERFDPLDDWNKLDSWNRKRPQFRLDFERIEYAECGECGQRVFFVTTKNQGFRERIALRVATCCVGVEIDQMYRREYQQEPHDPRSGIDLGLFKSLSYTKKVWG